MNSIIHRRQLSLSVCQLFLLLLPLFASSEGGRLLRRGGGEGGGTSGNYTATTLHQPPATPPSLQDVIIDDHGIDIDEGFIQEILDNDYDHFDVDEGFIIHVERTRTRRLQQQDGDTNITSDMHHQADHIQPRIIGGNRVCLMSVLLWVYCYIALLLYIGAFQLTNIWCASF